MNPLIVLWALGPILTTLLFLVLWRTARRRAAHAAAAHQTALAAAAAAHQTALTQSEAAHQTALAAAAAAHAATTARYSAILSQEAEVARLQAVADALGADIASLRQSYAEKRALHDRLAAQVAVFDDRLAFAELGLYEPHFDFTDSERFKTSILAVRDRQKAMISAKTATHCATPWQVEGSMAKGATMINRQTRLSLRAFNTECEAAIANVGWNNAMAMEKRIRTAAAAIDRENASLHLTLTAPFVALKIEELRLTHEYRECVKQEKAERAELARAERDERRLLAEAEAAERAEAEYHALLTRARQEADSDGNRQRIADLEAKLAEAHARTERARAMAELTKCGYVYIISNIGSFGEDVVKIGLTRRLDPDDRVRELGDASVPFGFDTHAMIYSETATALESALHAAFADRRINMSNLRKEFFRVSLDEVEAAVTRLAPSAGFFRDREAQEWFETLARRNATLAERRAAAEGALPAAI